METKKIQCSKKDPMQPSKLSLVEWPTYVEPLCVIAEDFLSHLETLQDKAGNVKDITPEIRKWAFHSKTI